MSNITLSRQYSCCFLNAIVETSRTIALARLYGNSMNGAVIVAILLSLAPYLFAVIMQLLGLLKDFEYCRWTAVSD